VVTPCDPGEAGIQVGKRGAEACLGAREAEGGVDEVAFERVADTGAGSAEQICLSADETEGGVAVLEAEPRHGRRHGPLQVCAVEVRLQAVDVRTGLPVVAADDTAQHRRGIASLIAAASAIPASKRRHGATLDRARVEVEAAVGVSGAALDAQIPAGPVCDGRAIRR
jgi:hypothetical protein